MISDIAYGNCWAIHGAPDRAGFLGMSKTGQEGGPRVITRF